MLWWVAQTTLIAGALAVLATLTSRWKRLGAEARHALWLIVLIKLAIPPLVAWPWRVPDRWPAAPVVVTTPPMVADIEPAPAPVPVPAPALPKIEPPPVELAPAPRVAFEPLPVPPSPSPSLSPRIEPRIPAEVPRIEPPLVAELKRTEVPARSPVAEPTPPPIEPAPTVAEPSVPAAVVVVEDPPARLWDVTVVIVGLWLAGSLVVAIRRAVKVARFQRSLATAYLAPDWLIEEAARIGEQMGVRPPPVVMTPKVGTPLLWCLGRPRLILPEALVKRLEADRWPGILAHELAHLGRRDHWVVRLELLVELVWWWNPLFWHVRRKLHEESELACDAWVVRSLPERRIAYAEALVDVCEHLARASIPSPALGVGGAGATRSLEGRLLMILRDPIPRRPSRSLALAATLVAALALPAWTLGQQDPVDARPKVEAPPAPAPVEVAPKPDEPRPDVPQPLPPDRKPSKEAAEATVVAIDEAQQQRINDLKQLSFRYVVVARERATRPNVADESGGLGGLGRMGSMGGMMSLPPQDPPALGLGPATFPGNGPLTPMTAVRVEVADVVLSNGKATRLDVLRARGELLRPPGVPKSWAWDRWFVARDDSGVMALEMAWDSKGAVPFRWFGAENQGSVGDSLGELMAGRDLLQSLSNRDRGLDPLDPRPANLVGLQGSAAYFVTQELTRAEVAGVDLIDGQEVVRVAWIGNQWGLRGIAWYAPKFGFALVRLDATRDPYPNSGQGRMTWRKRASDFVAVGDHWLPSKVRYEEIEADPNGGAEPAYRNELNVAFEDFQLAQAPPANASRPKLAIQGLDDKSGQFTALPPEVPAGLVQRLEKAVEQSPFGPPAAPRPTPEPAAPAGPPAAPATPAPAPNLILPGNGNATPNPSNTNVQPRPALVQPAPAPKPKDAAQADPGIVAPSRPGFEDPIPVSEPKKTDNIPVKNPGDRTEIDPDFLRLYGADPNIVQLPEQVKLARQNYNKVRRRPSSANDPALESARQTFENLSKQNDFWVAKSREFRALLRSSNDPEARAEVAALRQKRDAVAAKLQQAREKLDVARNAALVQKGDNQVHEELGEALAEFARSEVDLAALDLQVKQALERLELVNPGALQAARDQKAAELAQAQDSFDRAKEIVERNKMLAETPALHLDPLDLKKGEETFKIAEAELARKKAELAEAELLLYRPKEAVEPKEVAAPPSTPVNRDEVALWQARRDGKAADVQKAEAQKRLAQAVVTRNAALIKKDSAYVSREEMSKADGELALADAELARRTADLAEADILLDRAKRAGSVAKAVEPPTVAPGSTLAELRDAVELLEVQLLGKQVANRQALGTQPERERREIEVREYELRLKQARRRVEAETARLKREIERVQEEVAREDELVKTGVVGEAKLHVVRSRLNELMFQLDPKFVPVPPPATEPKK